MNLVCPSGPQMTQRSITNPVLPWSSAPAAITRVCSADGSRPDAKRMRLLCASMAERAVRLVSPDDVRVALSRVAMNGVREGEVGA
jgi:hypothetical protein